MAEQVQAEDRGNHRCSEYGEGTYMPDARYEAGIQQATGDKPEESGDDEPSQEAGEPTPAEPAGDTPEEKE